MKEEPQEASFLPKGPEISIFSDGTHLVREHPASSLTLFRGQVQTFLSQPALTTGWSVFAVSADSGFLNWHVLLLLIDLVAISYCSSKRRSVTDGGHVPQFFSPSVVVAPTLNAFLLKIASANGCRCDALAQHQAVFV